MASQEAWTLRGFGDQLASWIERESPDPEIVARVVHWIETRAQSPYLGVARERGFPNLWYGTVPGTIHSDGTKVVVSSYWIIESEHAVRADLFGTLSLPV